LRIVDEKPLVISLKYLENSLKFIQCLIFNGIIRPSSIPPKSVNLLDYSTMLANVMGKLREIDISKVSEYITGKTGQNNLVKFMYEQSEGVIGYYVG